MLALFAPVQARAQTPANPNYNDPRFTPNEVSVLPEYCQYKMGLLVNTPEGTKHWVDRIGPVFEGIHHYCYGMIAINRSMLARRPQDRLHHLSVSINEFDFVIKMAPKEFVLLPEILTKKGESLIRIGKGPQGIIELENAIALKPDYWPPYIAISDFYKNTGNIKKAREVLEKAVSLAPDAKTPKRRLAELDEAKSKPRPAPPPSAEPAPAPAPKTAPSKPPVGK